MQQVDDPPYLSVGTEVSAKYKGAFCEAKVRKVDRNIKCKVTYKQGLGSGTVSDDQIKGDLLRVGATVEVRHPDRSTYVEAVITKIQDSSQYTVVFDDGDITTLRRSALCLKSGRHFNESETLDQLPLTHPEHFGNPVIGGRRGRRHLDSFKKTTTNRSRLMADDSSDDDDDNAALLSSSKHRFSEKEEHIGQVVCVENTETKKKTSKENWFPALVVAPTAQDAVRIRVKDEYLVRSFKDGRYYTVPKKEATEFRRDRAPKQSSDAVTAALEYLNDDMLPTHWDRDVLFAIANCTSESENDDDESESSDDEPCEEKDHFVAQLYKYMDDRGTPLNKVPCIVNKDIDLYRLYMAVRKLNGYNKVTSQSQWKQIATRLGFLPVTQSIQNLVKLAYKKFLLPFEEFDRKLGCTMVAHPRANRIKGRSLVRANSVASPKPDKEMRSGGGGNTEESETTSESGPEIPKAKRKLSTSSGGGAGPSGAGGKVKAMVVKYEDKIKDESPDEDSSKDVDEKPLVKKGSRDVKDSKDFKAIAVKVEKDGDAVVSSTSGKSSHKPTKEEPGVHRSPNTSDSSRHHSSSNFGSGSFRKEKLVKRPPLPTSTSEERKASMKKRREMDSDKSGMSSAEKDKDKDPHEFPIEVGDRLKVYYHEQKVTYEAKVIEISLQQGTSHFLVHYTGWNTRYDEWVPIERVAVNLTNSKTNIRAKTGGAPSISKDKFMVSGMGPNSASSTSIGGNTPKGVYKRGRGRSRGESQPPRSTTPSSVASNSSRTKSPATPAQRRPTRGQPSSIRRTSNNTDISSIQTDSDTDSDEPVKKPTNRKNQLIRVPTTQSTSTSSNSVGTKTNSNASSEEESPIGSKAKGREFDLNQIRSELKGFKDFKSPTPEEDETSDNDEAKKFDFPSSASVTTSDSIASDLRKPIVSSDSDTGSDSYGDDDSQFSDKTSVLENISEKLQEKFKAGKLQTDVFKKIVAAAPPPAPEVVEKMAVLKPSGIEKIIKNSLVQLKELPAKMTMSSPLKERSPVKVSNEDAVETEKVATPSTTAKTVTTAKAVVPSKVVPSVKSVAVAKTAPSAKAVPAPKSIITKSPPKTKPAVVTNLSEKLFSERIKSTSILATGSDKKEPSPSTSRTAALDPTSKLDKSEKRTIKSDVADDAASSDCDIYEFKEPEPFEFETVKKLSPETEKKAKKKPFADVMIDAPKPQSASPSPAAKKAKKVPDEKQPKLPTRPFDLDPDEPMHSPPLISPPTVVAGPAKPESIFDSLRKSPSFNAMRKSPNFTVTPYDDAPSTSTAFQAIDSEPKTHSIPIVKPTFVSSFIETTPAPPITTIASPPLSLIVPLALLMESPPKARSVTPNHTQSSSASKNLDDKLKIFDAIDADDDPVPLDTVKKIHFSEEIYVVPPKFEKPSSIADKVLKVLNQQKTDAAAAAASPPIASSSKHSSPTTIKSESTIVPPKETKPNASELPKIEFESITKPDSGAPAIKPRLSSTLDHSKIDYEPIASKNHDLSQIINKLTTVVRPTRDLNELCDDSYDSSDSEQRLVMDEDRRNALHVDEDSRDDDDPPDLDDAVKSFEIIKSPHNGKSVTVTSILSKSVTVTVVPSKSVQQQSIPSKSLVTSSVFVGEPLSGKPDLEIRKVTKPIDPKPKMDVGKKPIEPKDAKKSGESKDTPKKVLDTKKEIKKPSVESKKPVEMKKSIEPKKDVKKTVEIRRVDSKRSVYVTETNNPPAEINKIIFEDASHKDITIEAKTSDPVEVPVIKQIATATPPAIVPQTFAASIPIVPVSVIMPPEPPPPTAVVHPPIKHVELRAESPLATPLHAFETNEEMDEDEDEANELVIVTKDDDDDESDDERADSTTDVHTSTSTNTGDSSEQTSGDSSSSHQQKESISMLLCEETIPGSPTPPTCPKDNVPETTSITQPSPSAVVPASANEYDTIFGGTANHHPIEADMKSVPMDLEPVSPAAEPILQPPVMSKPSDVLPPAAASSLHLVHISPARRESLSNDDSDDIRKPDGFAGDLEVRKRTRTKKMSECESSVVPIKRKKGNNSRRNTVTDQGSESEDNSEYTHKSSTASSQRGTSMGSSKQGQFNFLVQLDPALNSSQRIGIIHKKIQDLRKTYNHLKAELASIDRRRKKLRRRDRETKKNLLKSQAVN